MFGGTYGGKNGELCDAGIAACKDGRPDNGGRLRKACIVAADGSIDAPSDLEGEPDAGRELGDGRYGVGQGDVGEQRREGPA